MPQLQLAALTAVSNELPAVARELERMNRLKALELRIRIQNDWRGSANAISDLDEIMESR